MAVFDFTPDFQAQKTSKPRVTNIAFGDGYTQRVAYGLNTNPQNWNLSFANRDEDEADDIEDFLIDKNGVESFDWTPPGAASPLKFICQEWSRTIVKNNLYSISAVFVQVFDI